MGASGSGVGFAFALQIGLAIVVFLAFSWLRLTKWTRRFYAPKRFDVTIENKPRRLPPGFFAWMRAIYRYPEEELVKVAGLDSAMYLRTLQFGWDVFVWISLLTCIILLPINVTGDQVDLLLQSDSTLMPPPAPPPPAGCPVIDNTVPEVKAKEYDFSTFDKVSLTNLPPGSPKMWAHLVMVYIITIIVLKTLWRYNNEATLLRLAFLANAPRGGPSHTVLITDIPGIRHGTIIWYLRFLVGSTLFVMLPRPLKKKIMDTVESGINIAADAVDIGSAVGPKGRRSQSQGGASTTKKEGPPDALAKAADANAAAAEEREESRRKRMTGVLKRRRKAGGVISAHDPALDPWTQAAEVLGDMNEPRADAVKGFIYDEVEQTYGNGCVAAVNPAWDQGELNPLVKEYNKLRQLLEDYLDQLAYNIKRRKPIKKRRMVTVVPAAMGNWGIERYGMKPVKVDALDFWAARIDFLVTEIEAAQSRCLTQAIPTAFVTVHSREVQAHMATGLHHHDETTWQIQGAPEPKEIIWGNVGMRRWERALRTMALWAGYIALMLFYIIPVTAVQALVEVPNLARLPVLKDIVNVPFVKQFIEGVLPGLVLAIFLAILPSILALMCRLSGFLSISQVDFGVVTRYFYFQFVSVFIGSMIAGSLIGQLRQFIEDPTSIITILGAAIPMTATFFINYILVAGIGKTGIKHMRIPQLVIFWLLSKVAATPRARARLWADQYTLYGPNVPYFTIAFLLGMVYCCVNPIIAPVCLIYFSFSLISERYNDLYVFKREYESGGKLWYYVFNQFVTAVYTFQIVMIILLAIKKFKPVFALIPLPFVTFVFHMACLKLFKRPWTTMSAHDAAFLDRLDAADLGQDEVNPEELATIQDMYLSPALKVHREDVVDLLHEAHFISRRVNGEAVEDIEAALDEEEYASAEEDGETPPAPAKADLKRADTPDTMIGSGSDGETDISATATPTKPGKTPPLPVSSKQT